MKKIEVDPADGTKSSTNLAFLEESDNVQTYNDPQLKYLKGIHTILKDIQRERYYDKVDKSKEIKYQFAAIVMDEFFFYLSIVYFIITFCTLILNAPNFYRFL